MEIISGYVEVHIFRRKSDSLEFLMLQRGDKEIYPGLWQMVTGKIRGKEKAYETALREMKEETGLEPVRFWVAPKVNQFYQYDKDAIYVVPVFAAEVLPESNIKICDEHCGFKWVTPVEAHEILPWDEQRKALDIITGYILKMPDYIDLVKIKI
ncbi:MAG: NUDIX pyrophosphatase [Ignavibacteriales bacterium]|nr:MAG: NUDIX pyrophosphatase [Ignavibacteriales bacterium]